MAADDARAQRIRQLKEDNPAETWGSIAEAIGVKERSAVEWARSGGISYENAKKVAAHFGCDLDWLWRGDPPATPDLMADLDGDGSQLDRIEQVLTQLVDDQRSHELAQKALGEALAAVAGELAALRDAAPARRQRAS